MHKLLIALLLTLPAFADPSDRQVVEFYQRWNTAITTAHDFNALAPMMSKGFLADVAAQDVKDQQALFGMLKMASAMGGMSGATWTVASHRRDKGMLIYKLVRKGKGSSASAEFPVAEEDGQLKADMRKPPGK